MIWSIEKCEEISHNILSESIESEYVQTILQTP